MKINLNKKIQDLDGKDVESGTLAEELAIGLSQQSDSKNPLKVWEWCLKLKKDGIIELDTQDYELFKEEISKAKGFTVFFTGQILMELSKQKK